jgi:CheY-like chemotaxis protein
MKNLENILVRIAEIAKLADVLPSTVRYYTDLGLITPASQTKGGHRLYERNSALQMIKRVQLLSQNGNTMEEIRGVISKRKTNKKIMVIDDDPDIGNLIAVLVKEITTDIEVKVVNDGFSAGRMLDDYLPDLIILDLMLPGINGFEVCKSLKTNELFADTKILAITGYDSDENRKKIFTCGANDYLTKPINLTELQEKILALTGMAVSGVRGK